MSTVGENGSTSNPVVEEKKSKRWAIAITIIACAGLLYVGVNKMNNAPASSSAATADSVKVDSVKVIADTTKHE